MGRLPEQALPQGIFPKVTELDLFVDQTPTGNVQLPFDLRAVPQVFPALAFLSFRSTLQPIAAPIDLSSVMDLRISTSNSGQTVSNIQSAPRLVRLAIEISDLADVHAALSAIDRFTALRRLVYEENRSCIFTESCLNAWTKLQEVALSRHIEVVAAHCSRRGRQHADFCHLPKSCGFRVSP